MGDAISRRGAIEGNRHGETGHEAEGEAASAGSKSPAKTPSPGDNSVSPEQLKAYYRDMLLIRRFEERAGQLYGMGLIGGFCHLYIGQEAVVVGMQSTIDGKDAIITSYRDHGHMLAAGMDPKGVMAELTGRSGGYSKGKGGSMHMFSREKNFYGGHGIVGAQVPIGTGLAFAHKYNGDKNVSLTYFGDGCGQPGPGLRGHEHGRALEAAGHLHHREQPLRHGHLGRARLGDHRALPAWRGLRHSRRARRRHGRAGGASGRREGGRACPRRQGPVHPRDADLSLPRPFDERPGQVPDQGRSRQVPQRARSDRPCAQAPARRAR